MTDSNKSQFRPKHPIMVWDGECEFCRLCADRFKSAGTGKVEFIPFQDLHSKYPKAPQLDYKKSVVFFSKNGIRSGAAAIYGYYSEIGLQWPLMLYKRLNVFSKISEILYQFIANNRKFFRQIGQVFWGSNFLADTYKVSGWLYGRLLGLVGLIAFFSFWTQSDLLISSEGLVPFKDDLQQIEGYITTTNSDISKWYARPTLLWLSKTDLWLDIILFSGIFSSILLFIGIIPHISIAISWVCYLSISSISEPFLNFQWDTLLLEAYLLSFFFVPWKIYDNRKKIENPSIIGKWLLWLLIIKLMFESGLVKFTFFGQGGSNTWRDLTALNYHFWTQPIPSWISWYIDQLPSIIDKVSLFFTYWCELIVPFMIFFPRRIRRIAFFSLILFQILIILTGNYGFFNLLTIILCVTLLDDQLIAHYFDKWLKISKQESTTKALPEKIKMTMSVVIFSCFIYTTIFFVNRDLKGSDFNQSRNEISNLGNFIIQTAQVSRSLNAYGLFRVMTITRPEIYIEVLNQDSSWVPIIFKYKPVKEDQRPKFFFPHMPRIDWQIWFEALYFERLISNPFALSTYQRFLQTMVSEDLERSDININNFIKDEDRKILSSLQFSERQNYVRRLEASINNHLRNSYWFSRFLSKLAQKDPLVASYFDSNDIAEILSMRVSLYQYSFSSGEGDSQNWWDIDKNNSPSIVIDLR